MTHDEIMAMTDDELDCAVAVAHGWKEVPDTQTSYKVWSYEIIDGGIVELWEWYHPSTNGQQLFEIMEREKIDCIIVFCNEGTKRKASTRGFSATGKTINQAVLRCYLLSKQGENNVS